MSRGETLSRLSSTGIALEDLPVAHGPCEWYREGLFGQHESSTFIGPTL